MKNGVVDVADVAGAVALLEAACGPEARVSWELTRITNRHHGLCPYGEGFGVTLTTDDRRVFEKAGHGRTVTAAVEAALARLRDAERVA